MGAWPPYPHYIIMREECGKKVCAAGRDCASMCFLAKLLTTSRAGLAGSAVLSFGYGKPLYSLIYNNRAVRKAGLCGGQRMGVCLLPGKSLSGARTGLTDSAVSAFGCSAAVLFYQSGTARRSAPPPFSPSSQQWGMGRKPHPNGRAEKSASSVRGIVS